MAGTRRPGVPPVFPPAPLADPAFGGKPGPYSVSPLRDVCGTRINPYATDSYYKRDKILAGATPHTCASPEIGIWIADVGSLDPRIGMLGRPTPRERDSDGKLHYLRFRQPPRSERPFSSVIPRIPVRERMPFPIRHPATYAIDYVTLGMSAESRQREWVMHLRELFPEGSQLLLTFNGSTTLKFGLWTDSTFWQQPFLDNFDAICIPDFYGYCDDPIPQMLIGERMQQIFAAEGAAAGRPIIPTVAWTNERDLRNQMQLWSSLYPAVNTILLDGYGSGVKRVPWVWRWIRAIRKYCAPHTEMRFIVAGLTAGYAVAALRKEFPEGNFHLMTSLAPFIHSTSTTRPPGLQADDFQRKLKRLEGIMLDEEMDGIRIEEREEPEPSHWPDFSDCRIEYKP